MKEEIEELFKLRGKKFDERLDVLHKKYKDNATFKNEIKLFITSELKRAGKNLDLIEKEINLRDQLSEVSQIISLSYITKNYFGKTRNWLYQRINGNTVNGKQSKFTSDKLLQLQAALKDVGKKIGSLSIG